MITTLTPPATTVSRALSHRIRSGLDAARRGDLAGLDSLADADPVDARDALSTLLRIHALHLAPLSRLRGDEAFQHHPALAAIKLRLERRFVADLDDAAAREPQLVDASDPIAAVRRLARANLVPAVYEWVATRATSDELVEFLAIEGGPDGGFDDLVALAQIGLDGIPKVVLGANYWDEMGRGDIAAVHTTLHRRLSAALELPPVDLHELPLSGLRRSVLNGVLATNRALQPEMLGALGVLELQAGPRCRRVLTALTRIGAPADAFPFYAEHAEIDPRHGKEWLDDALTPLAAEQPGWGLRFVRGARWRCLVNDALFEDLLHRFAPWRLEPAAFAADAEAVR